MKLQINTTKDIPDLVFLSLRASGVDIDNDVALPRVSGDSRA